MQLRDLRIGFRYLIFAALFYAANAAGETGLLPLDLPSGQQFEINRYSGAEKSLVLWLPSERGFGKTFERHAEKLARFGHEVWLVDLHANYFIEPGRRSIRRFPLEDVVAIIEAAMQANDADIVLLGSGRGAQLTLIAAREWQLRNPGNTRLKGAVLMHAYLYQTRPGIGESAVYLPIASATNLPVYLLDSQYSTKSARIRELAEVLAAGGIQVYTQVMTGVQGGFYARDDNDSSAADIRAKRTFAATLNRAVKILETSTTPKLAVATDADTRQFSSYRRQAPVLTKVEQAMPAPALELEAYDAPRFSLQASRGQVLLVNFWASWCKPCVDEIPSLHRLEAGIDDPEFAVVTVNVGEDRGRIDKFLQRVPVALPLLMDRDSRAARDWKIFVYPSSYLVDRQGEIRYAYLGALEWDSPNNIAIIRGLLSQP